MTRRRLPPLNALRAFEAAARHLNFEKAGDELAVTASAVGQQVKSLEEWVGRAAAAERAEIPQRQHVAEPRRQLADPPPRLLPRASPRPRGSRLGLERP